MSETKGDKTSFEMAESFFRRSSNKLGEAREQLTKKFNYPESISASQESMEFSIKSIFLYFERNYPKSHEFADEQFMKLLESVPKEHEWRNFPRLLLLTKFWSKFYETAKYGNEKLGVGPEKLFKRDEAEMALKHAEECHSTAYGIKDWIHRKRIRLW